VTGADVLVVGAGPAGLTLAGDLATAGHAVTVVERRPKKISNLTRAFIVHARTLEQLDARGLADELVEAGTTISELHMRALGLRVNLPVSLRALTTRFPFVLLVPQFEVERLLERRAVEAGVRFRYGTEVLGLRQDEDGVDAEVRDVESGADDVLRAPYLVGCDGARSTVRSVLGLPFPGTSIGTALVAADVSLDDAPQGAVITNSNNGAFAFVAPIGDGWYRVGGFHRARRVSEDEPLDLEEVREVVQQALGTDFGMKESRWKTRFGSEERQVPDYRVDRVLLAGDAAHVHSPVGGLGMNTGIQDSANLGWKLSAVLNGRADDTLLDTYQAERHPVGKLALRSSGSMVRFAMAPEAVQRMVRPFVSMTVGRIRPLKAKMVGMLSGLAISYPAQSGAHHLAGKRALDSTLGDGTRLYEALRAGRFVLIAPADEELDLGSRGDRVVRAAWRDGHRRALLLVRPDAYVAWATEERSAAERAAALETALAEWTGPAAQLAA
jgi:2-polyprenyl-6-methoxyphenol hydroxylase-like FAD-dependent oxidoreductase